ncbi:hypothetical protein JW979_12015 [bacterium]|nr:hypothetical protein [candidate division CSSED10-310 bacterium]
MGTVSVFEHQTSGFSITIRWLTFIICCLFIVLGAFYFWFYTVEDAYISFRYAKNILSGNGVVYNPGEYVEGYTNFLWVMLLAVLGWVIDIPVASKIAGLVFAIGSLACLCFIHSRNEYYAYAGPVAAIVLATSPGFQMWSVSGLETSMFIFFLVAAVMTDQADIRKKELFSGLLFGLATLTRPEGVLFLVLYLLPHLKGFIHKKSKFWQMMGGFSLIVIPHMIFRLLYYNAWIPNTFWVKGKRFSGGGFAYFKKYGALTGLIDIPVVSVGLVLLVCFLLGSQNLKSWMGKYDRNIHHFLAAYLPVFSICLVYSLYVYIIGGDWMPFGRFLIPLLPFLGLGASMVIVFLQPHFKYHLLIAFMVLNSSVSIASMWYNPLMLRKSDYVDKLTWEQPHFKDWKTVGEWIARNWDDNAVMSTGLGGIIPYYAGLKNIDRGGLNSKMIAQIIHTSVSTEEEQRKIDEIVLQNAPDYIFDERLSFCMLRDEPTVNYPPANPNSNNLWTMGLNPAFNRYYRLKWVKIGDKYFSFYERR